MHPGAAALPARREPEAYNKKIPLVKTQAGSFVLAATAGNAVGELLSLCMSDRKCGRELLSLCTSDRERSRKLLPMRMHDRECGRSLRPLRASDRGTSAFAHVRPGTQLRNFRLCASRLGMQPASSALAGIRPGTRPGNFCLCAYPVGNDCAALRKAAPDPSPPVRPPPARTCRAGRPWSAFVFLRRKCRG